MKLAFVIYRLYRFGGKSRNFMAIAAECARRGHDVTIVTMEADSPPPEGCALVTIPGRGWSNVGRYVHFARDIATMRRRDGFDLVISGERMPGIDVYYAGDSCFVEHAITRRSFLHRLTRRYRHFRRFEEAVCSPDSSTNIMALTPLEIEAYRRHHGTPSDRFGLLPPNVTRDRQTPPERRPEERASVLREHGLSDDAIVMVSIGSDLHRKGVDRSIRAIASIRRTSSHDACLLVIGGGGERSMRLLTARLGVGRHVRLLGTRQDVGRHLAAADVLLHPARLEATGTAIVEGIAAGIPVVTTSVCGYAFHVTDASAGVVLDSPFDQRAMNEACLSLCDEGRRRAMADHARRYAANTDLYGRAARGADLIEEWSRTKLVPRHP